MQAVQTKKENFFTRIGKGISNFFADIGNSFIQFGVRFRDGSIGTKLSHIFMGAGNIYHKQYIKGILYFGIEALFILFMVLCPSVNSTPFGYKAVANFFTLGSVEGDVFTQGDNSMLMLLFGVITIGIIVMFILVYLSNLRSAYQADLDQRYKGHASSFKQDCRQLLDGRFHVLMMTPAMVGITIFTILPTIFMILIAFTNFDKEHPMGLTLFDWVGLKNFADVFGQTDGELSRFMPVLGWTVMWAFCATFLCYFGGIVLALLINKKGIRGKAIFRTIFILTIAFPQFISLLAMRNILATEGPLQTMLVAMGILEKPMEFLEFAVNPWTARITIILINMWIGVPYTMLMTTGILMNIPPELYEAAKIDGAKPVKQFMKITLPYIFFITTPYLISQFIGNMSNFNVIFLLTKGLPLVSGGYKAGSTDLLVTWLFKLTIEEQQYNLGSVICILTFIITSFITLITYRNTKSYKEEDTFQ